MPKETVYSDDVLFEDDAESVVAEVRWGRETAHVELVTRAVIKSTGESVEKSRYPDQPFEAGVHMGMNRKQINDLIRNLRRARDQAFGRDE